MLGRRRIRSITTRGCQSQPGTRRADLEDQPPERRKPLPFKRFQAIFLRANERVSQVVQRSLNLADALRPLEGVWLQATMDQFTQRRWRSRVALLHRLEQMGLDLGIERQ